MKKRDLEMKEFMLLIRNTMDSKNNFNDAREIEFLESCRVYITALEEKGQLISAQPMVREGVLLSGNNSEWHQEPFNESKEVIVGYYHIRAASLEEAIEIAKGNPEFAFTTTARVEVRPLKMKETSTGYQYPNQ